MPVYTKFDTGIIPSSLVTRFCTAFCSKAHTQTPHDAPLSSPPAYLPACLPIASLESTHPGLSQRWPGGDTARLQACSKCCGPCPWSRLGHCRRRRPRRPGTAATASSAASSTARAPWWGPSLLAPRARARVAPRARSGALRCAASPAPAGPVQIEKMRIFGPIFWASTRENWENTGSTDLALVLSKHCFAMHSTTCTPRHSSAVTAPVTLEVQPRCNNVCVCGGGDPCKKEIRPHKSPVTLKMQQKAPVIPTAPGVIRHSNGAVATGVPWLAGAHRDKPAQQRVELRADALVALRRRKPPCALVARVGVVKQACGLLQRREARHHLLLCTALPCVECRTTLEFFYLISGK